MEGYQMILNKRENAAKIKATFAKLDDNNKLQTERSAHSFPVYEDYKNYGHNYKNKK
jgi:hypothetical protein